VGGGKAAAEKRRCGGAVGLLVREGCWCGRQLREAGLRAALAAAGVL